MTQQIGGYPPPPATGPSTDPPTTQVARDEAAGVGRTAADAGRQVAGTAAEQAGNVAQEVRAQARDLLGEARGQVQDQARTGQQKAAEGVRALSRELREMADAGPQSGLVSEVARQAADRADALSAWLGEREPGELVEEVRLVRPAPSGSVPAGHGRGRRRRRTPDARGHRLGTRRRRPDPARAYGGPEYGGPSYVGPAYGEPVRRPAYGEPGYARTPGAPLPTTARTGPAYR